MRNKSVFRTLSRSNKPFIEHTFAAPDALLEAIKFCLHPCTSCSVFKIVKPLYNCLIGNRPVDDRGDAQADQKDCRDQADDEYDRIFKFCVVRQMRDRF